jgi:hypothetical protein
MLDKNFDPAGFEARLYAHWEAAGVFGKQHQVRLIAGLHRLQAGLLQGDDFVFAAHEGVGTKGQLECALLEKRITEGEGNGV